ncbi:MAG: RHS repeat protein, partial [Myxococcales bacterium]|nr:RHS repeat protein [Myxococcales bacterium]
DGPAREERWYYDGEPFVGLPAGEVDQGKRTRVTRAVSADAVIEVERNRFDAHGNVVETLDGLGAPGVRGHRRFYAYDPDGLHVVQTDIELEDGALRRESRYDPLWDAVVESTAWMRVVDGAVRSARRSHFFTYDEFGRLASRVLPGGDTVQNPTEVFVYELGAPRSRVVTRRRSVVGGQLDLQSVRCVDGRGRTYETRTEIADGAWQVDGYAVFDPRGDVAAQYQPYRGADGDCADAPPAGGLAERRRYDAQGRPLAIEHPDGDERGAPSVRRFEYAPLRVRAIDELGSPVTRLFDGLGRLVAVERALGAMSGGTDFAYDALGHLATVTDPLGVAKVQTFDRAGRVLRVEDIDRGALEFAWDAAGNLVERRDARGVALRQSFDAANRLVARGAADDAETIWIWDEDPACDPALCTNTANQVAAVTWPGGGEQQGFDARGRPLARARTLGDATYRVDFAYDNADRPVRVTYPGGARVDRRFDGAGRETAIEGVAPRIDWDARGLLARVEHADGTVGTWAYDARRQLVERRVDGDGALLDLAYTYDRRGALTAVRDGADAVTVTSDAWRRVTTFEAPEATLDFTYDLGDRLIALGGPPDLAPGDLTYADGTHRVRAVGEVAYAHDAAGLLTQRGDAALDWDAEGRLIAAGAARFGYGAGPERLQRFEGDSRADFAADDFEVRDGVGTLYVRLGLDRIARREEVDLAVELLGDPNGDGRVDAGDAWLEADDRPTRLRASARRLLVETGAADTALHADRVGSIVLATAGEVVGEQRFTPFGRTL